MGGRAAHEGFPVIQRRGRPAFTGNTRKMCFEMSEIPANIRVPFATGSCG